MKKVISTILALSMLCSATAFTAVAKENQIEGSTIAISEYTNNEVFVMYNDGIFEVLTYENEEALSEGLEKLSSDDSVMLYQPNYSYSPTGTITSDELSEKQWALSNDGSFYMEEAKNEFPVFENPFGDKQMPGQWQKPDNFQKPGGGNFRGRSYRGYTNTKTTALDGIDINIEEAWDIYSDSGKEVIVAVVDTGIDYTHEDLEGHIWTNEDEIAGNGIDDDGNGYIDDVYGWNFYNNSNKIYTGSDDDHGTHGAGTIIAEADNNTGIAGIVQTDNVKVMSVKALGGSDGSGTTASIIKAIIYAEANGASICNLSLGTSQNDEAIYKTMANSNMLFVVAAGNDGTDIDKTPSYPASYDLDNIITVANLNYDGNLHYSSSYGETSVDIAAPGSYILSTTTNNSYSYMSGTSMSAPMVSGAAALVYSHFEDITLADVKEILLSSARELDSLENSVLTAGMLDVGTALSFDTDELSGEQWEEKTPLTYEDVVNEREQAQMPGMPQMPSNPQMPNIPQMPSVPNMPGNIGMQPGYQMPRNNVPQNRNASRQRSNNIADFIGILMPMF